MVLVRSRSVEAILKIEQALAIAARARVRRRVSSDAAAQTDGTGTSSERLVLRDAHGRFVNGHAGGPGRPPRDCLREAPSDFLVWTRHRKQALHQLYEEHPAAYLRLIVSLVAGKRHNSK